MTRCLLCKRPTEDGTQDTCRDDLDEQLAALPGLYDRLEEVLEPGTGFGERVSGTRTPPLPVRLAPLALRGPGGMITTLAAWENDWRIERSLTPATRPNKSSALRECVKFLRTHLDWAVDSYGQIREFAEAVRIITANCQAATGETSDLIYIGQCPNTIADDGQTCGHALYVDPHASPAAETIQCPACRADWPRRNWAGLGEKLDAQRGAIPATT